MKVKGRKRKNSEDVKVVTGGYRRKKDEN